MNKHIQLQISKDELDKHLNNDDNILTITVKLEDDGITVDAVILDNADGNEIFVTSICETYSELEVQMIPED
jgi:hypothetical protein|tara:strand:- start:2237 stop:2452 length:216 start_codon:yes stop_codon:yes gene_type:complete